MASLYCGNLYVKNKQHCLSVLGALSIGLCALPASANFYAGALASYSNAEFKSSSVANANVSEGSPILLQAQAGYFFNDYLGLEARYGTSVQRDSGLAVDSLASAYVKVNMPVSSRVAIYGLAGYTSVEMNQTNFASEKEQGFSFGLGMHYALDTKNAVVFEFVDSGSEDNIRLNTMTIGFQHRF
ncbi:porin family protein [Vibrio scophthalmi]|uniref:porin family protein n=1 Tax=Vibrio scophthalmi TaxID=45658 RepID=UPI003AB35532